MHASYPIHYLRLVGSTNTNKVMAGELNRLAQRALRTRPLEPKKDGTGAILYPFNVALAALAVRYHHTSARVLWDLYESRANRLEPLYADLLSQMEKDDRLYLWDGATISVQAYGVDDFAAGERQVVGTVKNALIAGAATRNLTLTVDPDHPDLVFSVRMPAPDRVLISLDLAGRPMNQRGYRVESGEAPLREDVAAQLVMMTRHDARTEALVDPMAGSGTIAIEAACMAQGRYNWQSGRTPSAARLPEFAEHFASRAEPLFEDTKPLIFCSEILPNMCEVLRKNADTAGEARSIEIHAGDFRDWRAEDIFAQIAAKGGNPSRGVILTNPPYGHRMGTNLPQLYHDFARWCRGFPGWRVGVIVANDGEFERAVGGRPSVVKPVRNGALKADFLMYEL
ncbi:MAG: hypothetical protein SFV15_13985 [Polyangiaceae bacterium]|nr:hypothetical protein [Polyangiaceae bacterium]